MYSNVFLKTLRDGRRSMLLFALAQFVFGIYLALLFPDVASSFASMVEDLPEFIQAFVGSAEEFATPEGFFTADPYGVVTPIVMIALAINRGMGASGRRRARTYARPTPWQPDQPIQTLRTQELGANGRLHSPDGRRRWCHPPRRNHHGFLDFANWAVADVTQPFATLIRHRFLGAWRGWSDWQQEPRHRHPCRHRRHRLLGEHLGAAHRIA